MTALAGFWDFDGAAIQAAVAPRCSPRRPRLALTLDRDRDRVLVDRIAADALAASIIDTEVLRRLLRPWPRSRWGQPLTIARYRNLLIQTLSAAAFLLFALRPLPPPPPLPLERGA
ncbi:MAG: hypothetical protein QOH04_265 [Sphingomonadales bacterium]|jgi:hypothetical protein|nr:hypothetical protein [Sphingomonadales bacterium]